ncbi:MAG TPA: MaoC family dehydratase N-terminal domain-containing protein [Dehalococcoidia bacterium]|nr:MaoC family dehydratase N-terminal domain-containing protein [Dehalococcoidia bacterium]
MAESAAEESLITDEMRATIGDKSEPSTLEVDKLQIRLFARAVGHVDPIYFDEEEAKKAGFRSLPCPPGYLGTAIFDPRTSDATFGGRRGGAPPPEPRRPLNRILNGGNEFEYLGDICAGDVLTAVSYVSDIQERKASLGEMLITQSKTEYRNQNNELVAVATGTGIRY